MPISSLNFAQSSMCCQKWNVYMWAGLNSRPLLLFTSENKRRRLAAGSGLSPVRMGLASIDHTPFTEDTLVSHAHATKPWSRAGLQLLSYWGAIQAV